MIKYLITLYFVYLYLIFFLFISVGFSDVDFCRIGFDDTELYYSGDDAKYREGVFMAVRTIMIFSEFKNMEIIDKIRN